MRCKPGKRDAKDEINYLDNKYIRSVKLIS